jgi:hypothetical protein
MINIYRITEDGESVCIEAHTMWGACKLREDSYIDSQRRFHGFREGNERVFYQENVVESCELVATGLNHFAA